MTASVASELLQLAERVEALAKEVNHAAVRTNLQSAADRIRENVYKLKNKGV